MSDHIECKICGAAIHSVQLHLKKEHPEVTLDEYKAKFPSAPLLSKSAEEKLAEHQRQKAAAQEKEAAAASAKIEMSMAVGSGKRPLNELFGLGKVKEAMNAKGEPIPITFIEETKDKDLVPDIDPNYIFDVDILKNALLGLELGIPVLTWGHAGTGKSTLWEQIAARTGRPMIRVQHTVNTEESHIVGQWTVKLGEEGKSETVFELGPLAMAMKNGWLYLADEYDFALPSVLSVYQPVLEGKSLVIKEADNENRIIKPHPNFRIVATGNTNGSGDETGLYQGTSIQNEANYDRFGVTLEARYMKPELETEMLSSQAKISKDDAKKLVNFGKSIREAYAAGKISKPISPRALINAALLGHRRNSWRVGLALAFTNKLNSVDREVADSSAQRIFG